MAGKEGSTRRGRGGSTRRSKGRGTAGEAGGFSLAACTGGFSLGQCATKHMAVEEPVIGEEGSFSLRPCATKLMAAEEAVTGDVGHLKGCPTKRKSAGSAGARGECEQHPVAGGTTMDPMAVDLILEPQMISDAMLKERVKVSLLTFPEAAALDTDQLDVAVDRIIRESKPKTATPTTPGMCRLTDDDIGAFFSHTTELPTIDDLAPGGVFPAGWIEERRQQLDREVQPEKKKLGRDLDVLLAKIRVDLLTKGCVDVPELYFQDKPDVQAALMDAVKIEQATREHKEYTGVAGPDDEEWWLDDAVVTRLVLEST